MTINVRLSGELARIGGAARIALDVADGATVSDVRGALLKQVPDLNGALNSALPLVRGSHVSAEHKLRHGDELALLLPAAGG